MPGVPPNTVFHSANTLRLVFVGFFIQKPLLFDLRHTLRHFFKMVFFLRKGLTCSRLFRNTGSWDYSQTTFPMAQSMPHWAFHLGYTVGARTSIQRSRGPSFVDFDAKRKGPTHLSHRPLHQKAPILRAQVVNHDELHGQSLKQLVS